LAPVKCTGASFICRRENHRVPPVLCQRCATAHQSLPLACLDRRRWSKSASVQAGSPASSKLFALLQSRQPISDRRICNRSGSRRHCRRTDSGGIPLTILRSRNR
jgi:hypothetical protein